MDGRVPDEGAVVEAATAYMAGKPVVIYKSTAVTFWDFFNNPMVAALDSTWEPIADVCKLREALRMRWPTLPRRSGFVYARPPNIEAAYQFGEWVSANLRPLMAALKAAAKDLPDALRGLKPDMGSMKTFAEALIAGTKAGTAASESIWPIGALTMKALVFGPPEWADEF